MANLQERARPRGRGVAPAEPTGAVGWALVGAGVVVAGFAVPVLVARHYGALGIPRSDDWSYLVTLFRWIDHGHLSFNHWVSMNLVGQLVIAAPIAAAFRDDITATQVLTACLGTVGLGAVVAASRWSGVSIGRAALLALTIALGPLWGPLAVSFMTDVPAFACSTLALAAGVAAFRRPNHAPGWLAASVVLGFVAFSIRQYAIVPVIAVLVVAGWQAIGAGDRRRAVGVAVGTAAVAFACVALLAWWRTVPDGRSIAPGLPTVHAAKVLTIKGAGFLRLAGLLLLPLLAAVGPIAIVRRSVRLAPALTGLVAAGTALGLIATGVVAHTDLFVGNYVMHDGVLSDIVVIGPRPDVFPGAIWIVIAAIATVGAVVLAVATVPALVASGRHVRDRDLRLTRPVEAFLALSVIGFGATFVLAMATGVQVYDRYLLPVLPAAGILVAKLPASDDLPGGSRARRLGAGVALVGLAAFGLAFTIDSASFDGARWKAAEAATRAGWRPRQVNGGFEWNGFYARDRVGRSRRHVHGVCVTVHVNPRVAPRRVIAVVESTAPTRGAARLVAYRTDVPCAKPGSP